MAVKLRLLYNADLTATSGGGTTTPLDSGATKSWLISNIYFYNATGTAITVDIYVLKGGTGGNLYLVTGVSVPASGTRDYFYQEDVTLNHPASGADTIKVVCKGAGSLQCVVCGIERDQ
jgi:hypothetical protein